MKNCKPDTGALDGFPCFLLVTTFWINSFAPSLQITGGQRDLKPLAQDHTATCGKSKFKAGATGSRGHVLAPRSVPGITVHPSCLRLGTGNLREQTPGGWMESWGQQLPKKAMSTNSPTPEVRSESQREGGSVTCPLCASVFLSVKWGHNGTCFIMRINVSKVLRTVPGAEKASCKWF